MAFIGGFLDEPPVRSQELSERSLLYFFRVKSRKGGGGKKRKENPDFLLIVIKTSKIVGFFKSISLIIQLGV